MITTAFEVILRPVNIIFQWGIVFRIVWTVNRGKATFLPLFLSSRHLSFFQFRCECECDIFDLQIRTTFEYYYGGVMPNGGNSSMDDVLLTRVTERQARHGRDGKIKIK